MNTKLKAAARRALMPIAKQLAKRLTWFIPGRTKHDFRSPALLSTRWLFFALLLPWSMWWSLAHLQPFLVVWNGALVLIVTVDDFINYRTFKDGMELGRREMAYDMMDSWEKDDIAPAEYLVREMVYSEDDVEEARRTVRLSRKKTAGRHADIPEPATETGRVWLPRQVQRVLRRTS